MKNFKGFFLNIVIFFKSLLLILFTGICLNSNLIAKENIQLTQGDIESLKLSEQEAQNFQEFINTINNLSPAEQEQLEQLTKEVSNQMRQKGLDPENPDDVFKWIDEQQSEISQQMPMLEQIKEEPQYLGEEIKAEISCPKPKITANANPEETIEMLNLINSHISKLRQKASTDEKMKNQIERFSLELSELSYFLHVLTEKNLLTHLISKDFSNLHKNLECLLNNLSLYEPNIIGKKMTFGEDDDPYEILRISYQATQEEIDNAYNQLKTKYDPIKISKRLNKKNISEKKKKKQIKKAKIISQFIEDAYEILSNPDERDIIDQELKNKIEFQQQKAKSSANAFNKLIDKIGESLYQHRVLFDIHQLIEKYKPEELAKAKAQEEIEKKVIERSKQRAKITPSPHHNILPETKSYEQFYQKLAQESMSRNYQPQYYQPQYAQYPYPYGYPQADQYGSQEQPGKSDDKKSKEVKRDLKKPEEPKDKKEQKKEEKSDKPSAPSINPKDVEKIGLIENTAKLLEKTKDEIELEEKNKSVNLSDTEEPELKEKKKIKLKEIIQNLDTYLEAVPKEPTKQLDLSVELSPITNLKEFFAQNKIQEIWENLQKLNPDEKAKSESSTIKQLWKSKIYDKFNKTITSWYNDLYKPLTKELRQDLHKKSINIDKLVMHGLDLDVNQLDESAIKENLKKSPKYEKSSLVLEKKYISDIYNLFNNISKAMGIKPDNKK